MPSCVQCGSEIPADQGSRTCSMCYGDPDWGTDGYLRRAMEENRRQQEEESMGYPEDAEYPEEEDY